jgi:sec-independent protein translocase protein TatA
VVTGCAVVLQNMNTYILAFLGWPEIVAILAVVLLLFGAKKLPELARGLGKGINEFKRASRDVQDEIERAIEEPPPPPPPPRTPPANPTAANPSQSQSSTQD